eukprot:TRINITY_DN1940_c0_g1_i3.p1 TRINITY_DN1940_c0_g1~~TRINITY_DN1940_c0_g1_i3.p1  ORF type:complete len:632 (+),score=213.13 TRINITY_DN1940_c0_g1_i3:103-1896(+)
MSGGITPQRGFQRCTGAHGRTHSNSPPMPSPPPLLRNDNGEADAELPQLVDDHDTTPQQPSPHQTQLAGMTHLNAISDAVKPPELGAGSVLAALQAMQQQQAQMQEFDCGGMMSLQQQQMLQMQLLAAQQMPVGGFAQQWCNGLPMPVHQQMMSPAEQMQLLAAQTAQMAGRVSPTPSMSQGLTSTPTMSPQMQSIGLPYSDRVSPLDGLSTVSGSTGDSVTGYGAVQGLCRTLGFPMAAHNQAAKGTELPRESPWTTQDGVVLMYAAARGSNARVSWRNKLWSNTALLKRRYGHELPRFFRENYADRSPASEPLLHNNYPHGSRVFFQGRLSAAHCVCHHLVQVFEPFSVTEDGQPDPLGLQAVWVGAGFGRVYGYAKFADSRMANAAVATLRHSVMRRPASRELPPGGAPPPADAVALLTDVAQRISPPLLPLPASHAPTPPQRDSDWSPEAESLARVLHMLSGRVVMSQPSVVTSLGYTVDAVKSALATVDASLMARYGEGIVTCATIDSCQKRQSCIHTGSTPAREPVLLDDVSFANEQKPGHSNGHGGGKGQGRLGSPTAAPLRVFPPHTGGRQRAVQDVPIRMRLQVAQSP